MTRRHLANLPWAVAGVCLALGIMGLAVWFAAWAWRGAVSAIIGAAA